MADYLVCARVGGSVPVRGARIGDCTTCAQPIWIAPSSEAVIKQGYQPLCIPCALLDEEINNAPFDALRPEQMREITRELKARGGKYGEL